MERAFLVHCPRCGEELMLKESEAGASAFLTKQWRINCKCKATWVISIDGRRIWFEITGALLDALFAFLEKE